MGFDLLALLGTPLKIIGEALKQVTGLGLVGTERARAQVILGLSGALVLWVELETGKGAELLALMVSARAAMSAVTPGKASPGQGDDLGTATDAESVAQDDLESELGTGTEPETEPEMGTGMEPGEVPGSD